MRQLQIVCAVTLLLCGLVGTSQANLILNGDFQSGATGFGSDYTSTATIGIGTDAETYNVVNNPYGNPPPQNPYIPPPGYYDKTLGTASGLMLAVNGGTDASKRAWYQNVGGLTLGQQYKFDFWVSNWSFDPVADLVVKIGGIQQGPSLLAPGTAGLWQNYSVLWTATATSAEFAFYDLQTAGSGNDFALDDIQLTAVPEASTMIAGALLLLPFGASTLRILRRRQLNAGRRRAEDGCGMVKC